MPISPEDAVGLAKGIREIFNDAEGLLLQRIARAMARGLDSPDWAEQKLYGIRTLQVDIERVIDDLNAGVPGAVDRAVSMAYSRGIAAAGGDLQRVGMVAGAFGEIVNTGVVAAIVRDTLQRVSGTVFQIRRSVNDIYQQTISQTAAQVNTGVLTRRQASLQALTRLTANGISGFQDRSGRRWDMVSYGEMAVRTSAAQAALQGHSDRISQLGIDTVQVSNAPEECSICRLYEGRVLSLSGRTVGDRLSDGVVVLESVAVAKSKGLFHPQCRHNQGIYIPGVTKPIYDTEDPEGDALRQKQRAYERRIRELKRADLIAQEYGGAEARAARVKLRAKTAEFAQWRKDSDRKSLPYRTSLVSR